MSLMEAPERNLAFDLVRVTETAALASARWLGRGDKNAGDGAAVDAMRLSFNSLPIRGRVVIGEGEKDEAARLRPAERHCRGGGRARREHVRSRPQLLHAENRRGRGRARRH